MARRHRRGNRRRDKFAKGPRTSKGANGSNTSGAAVGKGSAQKAQGSKRPRITITFLLGLFLSAIVIEPLMIITLWIAKFGPNVLDKSIVWSVYSGMIVGLVLSLGAAAAITYFANRQFIDQGI